MHSLTTFFVLSNLLACAWAYQMYQDRIPNGRNVENPCLTNTTWPGVGHQNPNGGGVRNDFGLAFKNAGYTWTQELCLQDTDLDGKTNGEELGDPDCVWTPGLVANRTTGITHPGICEPIDSPLCKGRNSFVTCAKSGFEKCDSVVNGPNVSFVDLNFTQTRIPNSETNYYCMTFDFPSDQDYHIIADKPLIDNTNVVHHILLFGCKSPDDDNVPVPKSCGMSVEENCASILVSWTAGGTGNCYKNNVGFRIGKNGFVRVRLQIHYNNPALATNLTDATGMRIYYKPIQPGDQDLVMILIGQLLLKLPPHQSRIEVTGVCPNDCTKNIFTGPVNVIRVLNHMHYKGVSVSIEVFRNGQKIQNLSYDEHYSYDSPVNHELEPEFVLQPGDDIKTTCYFSTLNKSTYTYYGEATSDEMCFGFLTMYPKENIKVDYCTSFGSYSTCDFNARKPMGQCDWWKFINITDPETAQIFNAVTRNCNLDGFCRPECKTVLNNLKDHPCLQGVPNMWVSKMLTFETNYKQLNFLARLRSCPMEDDCSSQCPNCDSTADGSDKIVVSSTLLFVLWICSLLF